MLNGQKKHTDKEQGKTKHEAPHNVTYRATQNKNNIGTTALELSVVFTTEGFKVFSVTLNFTSLNEVNFYSVNSLSVMLTVSLQCQQYVSHVDNQFTVSTVCQSC